MQRGDFFWLEPGKTAWDLKFEAESGCLGSIRFPNLISILETMEHPNQG